MTLAGLKFTVLMLRLQAFTMTPGQFLLWLVFLSNSQTLKLDEREFVCLWTCTLSKYGII